MNEELDDDWTVLDSDKEIDDDWFDLEAERESKQRITAITRRDITDYLSAENIAWWGRPGEIAFLKRIWPELDEMPSTDYRFRTATRDIQQHRDFNYDWEDDWIFDDPRFNLRSGPDELFVKFLSEMLHPVVRPDTKEARKLLNFFNECLVHDDWEIAEVSQISGKPVFAGRRREAVKNPTEALDVDEYEGLEDPQAIRDHLRRIGRDVRSDPSEAIGSSKELVETVCKVILDDYGVTYSSGDDLMDLYKKVQKALGLGTDAVPGHRKGSKAAVKTLRALVTVIQSLAELRNAIGSGHGRTRRSPALSRHAQLAFNSAVALSEFLMETWQVRREEEEED